MLKINKKSSNGGYAPEKQVFRENIAQVPKVSEQNFTNVFRDVLEEEFKKRKFRDDSISDDSYSRAEFTVMSSLGVHSIFYEWMCNKKQRELFYKIVSWGLKRYEAQFFCKVFFHKDEIAKEICGCKIVEKDSEFVHEFLSFLSNVVSFYLNDLFTFHTKSVLETYSAIKKEDVEKEKLANVLFDKLCVFNDQGRERVPGMVSWVLSGGLKKGKAELFFLIFRDKVEVRFWRILRDLLTSSSGELYYKVLSNGLAIHGDSFYETLLHHDRFPELPNLSCEEENCARCLVALVRFCLTTGFSEAAKITLLAYEIAKAKMDGFQPDYIESKEVGNKSKFTLFSNISNTEESQYEIGDAKSETFDI